MEIDITIGGVTYNVCLEVEDGYVVGVNYASVYTCEGLVGLSMDTDKCEQFYARYEDDLNEAYQTHLVAAAECAAEARWENREDR